MGFFDRLFKGKALYTDKRNPGIVCEMTLCGQQHLLSEFDFMYDPDNHTKEYLEAYAVFSEPVNVSVEQWIMKSGHKEDVVVKFYRNIDALSEGAVFEMRFSDACCIRYRNVSHGETTVKTIVMTFRSIRVGSEEYDIRK